MAASSKANTSKERSLSTEMKSPRSVARTLFEQLRDGGYTQNQVIGVAGELLDLVREDLKATRDAANQGQEAEDRRHVV